MSIVAGDYGVPIDIESGFDDLTDKICLFGFYDSDGDLKATKTGIGTAVEGPEGGMVATYKTTEQDSSLFGIFAAGGECRVILTVTKADASIFRQSLPVLYWVTTLGKDY